MFFNTVYSAFRAGRGPETALLKTVNDLHTALHQNRAPLRILPDLSTALDRNDHLLLLLPGLNTLFDLSGT